MNKLTRTPFVSNLMLFAKVLDKFSRLVTLPSGFRTSCVQVSTTNTIEAAFTSSVKGNRELRRL